MGLFRLGADPVGRLQRDGGPEESGVVVALAHEHRVGLDAGANHKQRLWLSTHLKAFSLAHREEVRPVVLSHHAAHVWGEIERCRPFRKRCIG